AADADTHRAGAATLPLRLPDRVEDTFAHAVQVASGLAKVRDFHRQRVLNVLVLAAAALEQQFDLDLAVVLPLLEMHRRRAGAGIIRRVDPGQRINRVGAQLTELCGFGDSLADLLFHHDLIGADRGFYLEGWPAGVLAYRAFVVRGHVDVCSDDLKRLGRARA